MEYLEQRLYLSQGFCIPNEKMSYVLVESFLTWCGRSLDIEFWRNTLRTSLNLQLLSMSCGKMFFFWMKCFVKGLRSFRLPLEFPPRSKSAGLPFLTFEFLCFLALELFSDKRIIVGIEPESLQLGVGGYLYCHWVVDLHVINCTRIVIANHFAFRWPFVYPLGVIWKFRREGETIFGIRPTMFIFIQH